VTPPERRWFGGDRSNSQSNLDTLC
jgi:hypothetical protein